MMAAVYELATVKPHVRDGGRVDEAQWSTYCEGYYQALVMALRVMQLAVGRTERQAMTDKITTIESKRLKPDELATRASVHTTAATSLLPMAGAAAVAIFVLELLILLAALIVRVLR